MSRPGAGPGKKVEGPILLTLCLVRQELIAGGRGALGSREVLVVPDLRLRRGPPPRLEPLADGAHVSKAAPRRDGGGGEGKS